MTDQPVPPTVMVVDDDEAIRRALRRYLTRSGYLTIEAADGLEALDQLSKNHVAAMVCDIMMPGMTGSELLPKAIAREPDLAVIMLTGVGEPQVAIQCLKLGAVDYLIKPVDLEELGHSLQFALRKRELEIERRELEQWLTREVAVKTRELDEQKRQVEALSITVLTALVDALEPKDDRGRRHSVRVANLAAHVAAQIGLPADQVATIRTAARLHDLGHIAMREEVLRDATSAPAAELVGALQAQEVADRILKPLTNHSGVVEIVRFQHERFDGRGKPEGRRGEGIPIGARILAAANLYDELTAASADRPALTPAQAIESLRGLAGLLLDPAVLAALEKVVKKV